MIPRFVGRVSAADVVTTANAVLGFVAVVVAFGDVSLAARLMLLAAIADGLDGVLARRLGGSEVGPYLDSLADVASFGVAPAVLVYAAVAEAWGLVIGAGAFVTAPFRTVALVLVPGLFVAMAVLRLALYTTYDTGSGRTMGVPSTLAATIIGAAVLSGMVGGGLLLWVTGAFVYLMVSPVKYPDLLARDALLMGVVHGLAVVIPYRIGRAFPVALLTLGLAYLFFGPVFYWREGFPTLGLKGNA